MHVRMGTGDPKNDGLGVTCGFRNNSLQPALSLTGEIGDAVLRYWNEASLQDFSNHAKTRTKATNLSLERWLSS